MWKRDALLRTALCAAMISFAGTALAAGAQPDQIAQAGQPGTETQQPGAGEPPAAQPGAPEPTTPGMPPPGAEPSAPPSGAATPPEGAALNIQEGMEVVNAKDEKVGEVSRVEGDKVIISMGGFLGMGAREVALDRAQLQMAGTGEDAKLQTTMTEKELEALPEYKPSPGGSPEGAGSGGGGGGGGSE